MTDNFNENQPEKPSRNPPPRKSRIEKQRENRRFAMNVAYVSVLMVVFGVTAFLMINLPRPTSSETEKRELTKFPEFSSEVYFKGDYTDNISKWFSDTVPGRDNLMEISAVLQEMKGFHNDGVTLIGVGENTSSEPEKTDSNIPENPEPSTEETTSSSTSSSGSSSTSEGNHEIDAVDNKNVLNDDDISMVSNGIAVVGDRALMMYGGSTSIGTEYAKVLNKYKAALGEDVNVYSMVIPTACEFYSPPSVAAYCGSQLDNINNIIDNLEGVKAVDVYTALATHTDEDIYLRTDHHWAPLGAYYAAEAFAKTAGVPFRDLSEYEERVTHGYVGTMYAYSNYNSALKNNPDEFVYYVPLDEDYTATYYNYSFDDSGNICGIDAPYEDKFFFDFQDGSPNAYLTFMLGDAKIVHVETDTKNGRKLAIFKDSFGNCLPGYLFGSFEEIYVLDLRYFTYNGIEYLKEKGITDLLFANNAFNAANATMVDHYETILTQKDWGLVPGGDLAFPEETSVDTAESEDTKESTEE